MLEEAYNFRADEDWERVEARLRALTRVLIRRHRVRIERVADIDQCADFFVPRGGGQG